ncbi:hypothetical protein JCM5353_005064 [Sporobolomyces roseus]
MPSLATTSVKSKRAFDSLTRIATQIKIWEITLEPWVAEVLLSKNYNGIESLTLQSPKNAGFVILESNESQFLSLLSNCSNLRNLSIRQTHHFPGHPTSQNVDPVANSVLSTSFNFANSLRSLTLDLERFNGRITANEFDFIALFSALEYLNLTFRSSNLDEIDSKSFLLPKLTSLEVVNCPFLHMHALIRCLDLPSISTIHFAQTGTQNNPPTTEEEIDEMRKLASELDTYSSSLRALRLTSSKVSSEAVEELSKLQGKATVEVEVNSTSVVRSNDISTRAELRSRGIITLDDSDSEYSVEEDDLDTSDSTHSRQVDFRNDLGSTEELLGWAHDRFKMCRDVDVAGVEELARTLRLSRAFEDAFQYSILGSPVGNCIERLIVDNSPCKDFASFVCQTCPQLPKLRSIVGLDANSTNDICLTSQIVLSDPSKIAVYLKGQRARQILLQTASRITEWDIKLIRRDAELFLSQNYAGIESLILRTDDDYGLPILESADSKFPLLLSKCTNLRQLSIIQTHDDDEPSFGPVVDSVLTTSFPFAATLRSLSLDLERYGEGTTSNELEFPTLFPFLEVLKITLRSNDLDQIRTKSFILPRLLDLEVMHCPFSHMHVLIESLLLPNIRTIQLESVDTSDFGVTQDEVLDEIRKLEIELGASASTLRLLHLIFDIHVLQECITVLKAMKFEAAIFVNSKLINTSKTTNIRPRVARQSFYSGFDSDYDNDCGLLDYDEPLEGKVEKDGVDEVSDPTEALLNWASERITRCRDVDGAGSKEIRRVLDPVNDLRKWLTD